MTSEHSGSRIVAPKYNGVAIYNAATEPRQVLRNLQQSERLTVVGESDGGWLEVRLTDGTEGWVRRDTVGDPPAPAPPPPPAPAPVQAAPPPTQVLVSNAQPMGGGAAPAPPRMASQPSPTTARGFFSRLFDWSLREFITPSIIRFLFIAWVAVSTLVLVIIVLVSFATEPAVGVLMLVLSPLIFVLNVLVIRIYMELLIVIFRIEENTRRL